MRSRLFVLIALVALGALVASAPASAASRDVRAKKKAACSLKKKATCKKAKLKNVKVGKQNLSGANLAGATISGGTFTGTNLSQADLSNARISNVTFDGVNLAGANLSGAVLAKVRFVKASGIVPVSTRGLACASASDVNGFVWAKECAGTGVAFDGTRFENVVMTDCRFTRGSFNRAVFIQTFITDCDMNGSRFVGAQLVGATFQNTRFDDVIFDESTGAEIKSSFLRAASFFRAKGYTVDAVPSDRATIRGLNGGASVSVSPGAGAPGYTSIVMLASWGNAYWTDATQCSGTALSGVCRGVFAKGDSLKVTLTSPIGMQLGGASWTCTAPTAVPGGFASTCAGSLTQDAALTYQSPTSPATQKSVTLTVDDSMGFGIPTIETLTISTVSGGAMTTVKSCASASSCSALVDSGAIVRLSASDSAHVVEMQCPGSATWITGTSLFPPPSTADCPDFALSADVTAKVAGS